MTRCPHCNEVQFKTSHKPKDCALKGTQYDYKNKTETDTHYNSLS